MASAIFRLGRLKGIDRPAIGALFPTKDPSQQVLVLDVGANMDCKPGYLHQFALLGSIYSRDVLGVPKPSVGLLNIGEEECKGNELTLKAFPCWPPNPGFPSRAIVKAAMCSQAASMWWSAMATPATCS